MAAEKLNLGPKDSLHEKLMIAIAQAVMDTPLVLKGGTALMLAYGLDRFSEDLDFDSPVKLNLESKIRKAIPKDFSLQTLESVKNTETVTRYRVSYITEFGPGRLKIEVSYRTPASDNEAQVLNGIRVANISRILDQKLNAAHDGKDPRTRIRDLYDLDFISRNFEGAFTQSFATRLLELCEDPEKLVARYRDAYLEDDLVKNRVNLEDLAVRLNYKATELQKKKDLRSLFGEDTATTGITNRRAKKENKLGP